MDAVNDNEPGKSYALSGKIMLTAVVVLISVVIFIIALHLYARWYLLRVRRRQADHRRRRRASRSSQAFTVPAPVADKGLEIGVLNSLPVLQYASSKAEAEGEVECAVCLSEFEENETLRLLPKCNHSFHIGCIDMWFYSHSTCPLCRSAVEKVVSSAAGNSGTEDSNPPPPVRKCGEVRIDVPPRAGLPESAANQSSPGSRLLALRRILSMGRKSPATRCELVVEEGIGESSQVGPASGETTS